MKKKEIIKRPYHKLIRDNIPELIKANQQIPTIRYLEKAEFYQALRAKLQEEVEEFLEDDEVQELADIIEIAYALAQEKNVSPRALDDLRLKKAQQKGLYTKRVFLENITQPLKD